MSLPITEAKRYKTLALDLAVRLAAKSKSSKKKSKAKSAVKGDDDSATEAAQKRAFLRRAAERKRAAKTRAALATVASSAFARRVARLERAVAADRPGRLRAEAPRAEVDLGVGGDAMLGAIHARRMARQGRESRVAGSQPSARAEALRTLLVSLPPDQHAAAKETFKRTLARRTGAR